MSHPNPERDERVDRMLQVIVQTPAGGRIRMTGGAADLRSVITDVLEFQPYVVNTLDAERLADHHKIGSMPAIVKSVDYGATTLAECVEMAVDRWYHRGRRDAATRMRDRCVEKVRDMVTRLTCTCVGERADHHARCPVTVGTEMITNLQSLTLEVEQEKR